MSRSLCQPWRSLLPFLVRQCCRMPGDIRHPRPVPGPSLKTRSSHILLPPHLHLHLVIYTTNHQPTRWLSTLTTHTFRLRLHHHLLLPSCCPPCTPTGSAGRTMMSYSLTSLSLRPSPSSAITGTSSGLRPAVSSLRGTWSAVCGVSASRSFCMVSERPVTSMSGFN